MATGGRIVDSSFAFTILFMLLGPIRLLPAYAQVTRGASEPFKRAVAIRAAVLASAVLAFLMFGGGPLLAKQHISVDGLRIGGGLVLLLTALNTLLLRPRPQAPSAAGATPTPFAVSPIVTPILLQPPAIAAVLLLVALTPETPGLAQQVTVDLVVIMVLDFLAMYFNTAIMRASWLLLLLSPLGAVLGLIQACIGVESLMSGLRHMGAF